MEGKFVDPKLLEDGKILVNFKKNFIGNKKPENLYAVLNCLRDSTLIVPITPMNKDKFKPDIMRVMNGDLYLPIFSQEAQIPVDYKKLFTFLPLPMEKCIEIMNSIEGLKGLVLDPYTEGMFISTDMTNIIMEMESKVRPE